MQKIFTRRLLVYLIGIIILALGITLNTKTQLGISPIISVPYNISVISEIPLGVMTFIYYCFLILLQFLLLRSEFEPYQILQVAASLFTSVFIQIFDNVLPVPDSLAARIVLVFAAIIITALGASITVGMHYVPNPADGLADVVGQKLKKDLGFGKNTIDLISIAVALLIGFIFTGGLLGIGIGTILTMIFTGRFIALFRKPVGRLAEHVGVPAESVH